MKAPSSVLGTSPWPAPPPSTSSSPLQMPGDHLEIRNSSWGNGPVLSCEVPLVLHYLLYERDKQRVPMVDARYSGIRTGLRSSRHLLRAAPALPKGCDNYLSIESVPALAVLYPCEYRPMTCFVFSSVMDKGAEGLLFALTILGSSSVK